MNKKVFKNKLDFCVENSIVTPATIDELIKHERKDFFDNEDIYVLIKDNLKYIIDNCMIKDVLLNYLYSFNEFKDSVKDLIPYVLGSSDCYTIEGIVRNKEYLFDIKDIINSNFIDIFNNSNKYDIYKWNLLNNYECLDDKNKEFINDSIKDNKLIFCNSLCRVDLNNYYDKEDSNTPLEVVSLLVDELVNDSNIKYTDIKLLGTGSYSAVYQIGDKVLKLGSKRCTYKMPDDKRLLKPLIRTDLSKISDVNLTIEVSNLVDTNVKINDEELYQLYKELRNRGIVWSDVKIENLGYLLKDNTYNWIKNLGEDNISRGLITSDNSEALKKGDLVITDTDYLYYEGDSNIYYSTNKGLEFSRRYEEEKLKSK